MHVKYKQHSEGFFLCVFCLGFRRLLFNFFSLSLLCVSLPVCFAGLYVSTRGWLPDRVATGEILFNGDPLQQFEAGLCPIACQTNGG